MSRNINAHRVRHALVAAGRPVVETLESRRLLAFGDLDPTFGTGGRVEIDLPGFAEDGNFVSEVALQSDGKIVFAGTAQSLSNGSQAYVGRLDANGSIDTGFGDDGFCRLPANGSDFFSAGLTLLPDGDIIIAAGTGQFVGDTGATVIRRLNGDGTLDNSFGTGGAFTTSDFNTLRFAVSPNGRIVATGVASDDSGDDFGVLVLNQNGQRDAGFADNGVATLRFGGGARSAAVEIDFDAQGRFLVTGESADDDSGDAVVARFLPDGTLDTSFSGDGIFTADFERSDAAVDFVVQPDGSLLVGVTADQFNSNFRLLTMRVSASGTLLGSTDGTVFLNVPGGEDVGAFFGPLLVGQSDGSVLTAGQVINDDAMVTESFVGRLSQSGVPDPSVGANGLLDFTSENPTPATQSLIQQPNGQVIGGGSLIAGPTSATGLIFRLEGSDAAAGSIAGSVTRDSGPASNVVVYADLDGDGTRDNGEPSDFTDVFGVYGLTGLDAGSYAVRVDTLGGESTITPASGSLTVNLAAGQDVAGQNFVIGTATGNSVPTIASLTDSPDPAVADPTALVTLTANGVTDTDGSVAEVVFFRQDADGDTAIGNDADGSDGYSVTFDGFDVVGQTRTYYAIAVDDEGAESDPVFTTNTVVRPTPGNLAPTIASLSVSPNPVTAGDALTVTAGGVEDSDGSVSGVTFFRDGTAIGTDNDGSDGYTLALDTTGFAAGDYDYSAVATDDQGLTSGARFATSTVIVAPPPPPTNDDVSFTFLDAGADVRLFAIVDGQTYNRSELASNLSIEADGIDADAESVAFRLEGPGGLVYENTENVSFYTLFRNEAMAYEGSGDVLGTALPAGTYTLTATSYSADNAGGNVDETGSVTFTIVDDSADLGIASLTLVDAAEDVDVLTLTDGIVVTDVPSHASIVANVADTTAVESVRFVLNGPGGLFVDRVENVAPYALLANNGGDFFGDVLPAGAYTLSVTAYADDDATGLAGESLPIAFTVA